MISFFKKLFASPRKLPKGWNTTLHELLKEVTDGKRPSVGQPELTWAKEYERSLIPDHCRFPKKGDLYTVKDNFEIDFSTAWMAPYTGGGKATLFKGEQIWINSKPRDKKPIGTYALPVNYVELETRMVPAEEREEPKYNGFYFSVNTVDLNEFFELTQENFEKDRFE